MIEQYLPNNNETATVAFRQKFCQLNSPINNDSFVVTNLSMNQWRNRQGVERLQPLELQ
jgi:hypothetical protein